MNIIEAIENAQKKISKLGDDLNDVRFEIRRTSWGSCATQDDFKDIVILIDKDGIQRISKHDSKNCGLTLEDLKAQDWEVLK
jgi:hypothetical protein